MTAQRPGAGRAFSPGTLTSGSQDAPHRGAQSSHGLKRGEHCGALTSNDHTLISNNLFSLFCTKVEWEAVCKGRWRPHG